MSGGSPEQAYKKGVSSGIPLLFALVILLLCLSCSPVKAGELDISISSSGENASVFNLSYIHSSDGVSPVEDDLFGPGGLFGSEDFDSEYFEKRLTVLLLILLAYVFGIVSFIAFYFFESRKSSGYVLELSVKSRLVLFVFYLLASLICFALLAAMTVMGLVIGMSDINYSSFAFEILVFLIIFLLYIYLAYTVLRKKSAVLSTFAAPIFLLIIRIEMSVFYPVFSEFQTTDDLIFFIVMTFVTFIIAGFHYSGNRKNAGVPSGEDIHDTQTDPSVTELGVTGSGFSSSGMLDNSGFPIALKDNYSEFSLVGAGGTARVFKARKMNTGKVVALKVPLFFDDKTGKAFLREMRIWKGLSHKNIVDVFSVNILPVPYVEMEYIDSGLEELEKPMEVDRALRLFAGVAEGLSYVHSLGFAHRDIKPKNILVKNGDIPKITDWGLGKIMTDGTETTVSGFSLNYAAPEQISSRMFGKSGVSTDIYQAGVLMYEMLTGEVPFTDGQSGIGDQSISILNDSPSPPSVFNPELAPFDGIIGRCMKKRPEERYSSVEEIMEELRVLGFFKK